MLVIRPNQMSALRETKRRSFARRAEAHLRANFPECAAMAPAVLQALVAHGVERAAAHGIEGERDVSKFLNLMVVFGRDFDVDLQWARETLASPAGPRLRLSRLYARGVKMADAGGQK